MDETNTRRAHKITIVDVAKAAGVSHATVSRVLNNQGYIGEQTRLKVLDVVERLGYVANAPARSLAGGALTLNFPNRATTLPSSLPMAPWKKKPGMSTGLSTGWSMA